MNNRGMLLASETLKMVLAVISIFFLILLLVNIYFSVTGEEKKIQAESTMGRLEDVLSRATIEADFTSEIISEIVPSGWKIFIFTGQEEKPDQCTGINCVCICDIRTINVLDRQMRECVREGFCVVNSNLVEFPDIEIGRLKTNPTSIIVNKTISGLEINKI